ncbi:hypothetical protein BE221DRAFT_71139 [Ostreococcus tauri]|uniref:Uncharacterized protein n=1 Tax=Ostreococcus tauri TaxID=70448 RepID=A0A1Y5ICN1_OSTTA|nr:hypothetical protein BE221DRAFT_71139 [Ostreococcus tauri]
MPTARASTRTIVKRDHVICELPLELEALPGEQIRFEGLDTESPTLRTMDGRRYVGRYILGKTGGWNRGDGGAAIAVRSGGTDGERERARGAVSGRIGVIA